MPTEEQREKARIRQRRYHARHRDEVASRHRLWREENQDKVKGYSRKHLLQTKYGLTVKQYEDMHSRQGGLCAVCGEPETTVVKGTLSLLRVDHDHATGENRELLCNRCNLRLGALLEDNDWTEKAMNYLARHKIGGL